jgi:tetratricopeptide (TPR) repeat protein
MKQSFSTDKINLAWFKLEEFVARGEKEKALTIYRLLMHSINDSAVRLQLEGDILRAFNDPGAVDSYLKAAKLYEEQGKLVQAVEIYEFINNLMPDSYEHGKAMLGLYEKLSHTTKMYAAAEHVLRILIKRNQLVQGHELIHEIDLQLAQKSGLHALFVVAILESGKQSYNALLDIHLVASIKGYAELQDSGSTELTMFLAKLAALDTAVHERAQELLVNLA